MLTGLNKVNLEIKNCRDVQNFVFHECAL